MPLVVAIVLVLLILVLVLLYMAAIALVRWFAGRAASELLGPLHDKAHLLQRFAENGPREAAKAALSKQLHRAFPLYSRLRSYNQLVRRSFSQRAVLGVSVDQEPELGATQRGRSARGRGWRRRRSRPTL